MIQQKTPLYFLYYINYNDGQLVMDSIIYDTEIISSRDLESSTQQNMIEISVPKYRNAMSGEMQPTESRWINIMNNQRSGSKSYYIMSTSSYNSPEYLTEPEYTDTLRNEERGGKEEVYLAYRPYFAGHLTKIDSLSTRDVITFTFNGFDWYYSKKLMDPNRTKMYSGGDEYYDYANFYYAYDPTGVVQLGTYDAPTRIPVLTTNQNPDTQRSDVFYRQDSSTLQCKREGLHNLKISLNCQHTEAYSSGVTLNLYRDPNIKENEMKDADGNPIDRILIASKSVTLEGGSTGNQTITIQLTDADMYNMPSMDLVWQRSGNLYHKLWIEAYSTAGSDKNVTYSYANFWASTSCYSLDHDQIYEAMAYEPAYDYYNAQVSIQCFVDSMPRQIMDSAKIRTIDLDSSDTYHFFDPIVVTDGATRRMYGHANGYANVKYNFNKFTTTVKAAIDSLMSQIEVMPNWGTFMYEDGKISMDVASADSEDIAVYTDYVNTDILYNIRDDYYNHYYHYFGSSSEIPDNHYHTVSHTMTEYLNPHGKVQKDPVTMMTAFRYQKDEIEDANKTDEDIWNQMGVEAWDKHEQYIRNKYTYVYYPEKDFDLRVRIGDYFVSTPESPIQLRRRITGISRVCEGGIIKWIYKMEGDE